jgi:L-seryl-tRNA(Ser) seleniumtransferase/D-glucosaminate-6-phosphate ammonia-lyase
MSGIYERFGVTPVINAAGKLTALGGTAQSAEVAAAQAEAARSHVDLGALRARAGELIAERTGAEAASVTTGAAAGVVIATAAVVAGAEPDRVARLPDSEGWVNRVLIQGGHWINFGAPVEQLVRLGGGRPELVGSVNNVPEGLLARALADGMPVAALMYVQSHHSVQERMVPLERCVELALEAGVPVIVDAAAEEDLRRYIALGCDLVTYSGGKAFGGPTVGFIAGRRELIAACEAQTRGIARPMKVGKEQILGLLVALERYDGADAGAELERRRRVNAIVCDGLDGAPGVEVSIRGDEAGRPIERVALRAVDGAFDVRELVAFLESGSPSIRTRNHHLDEGVVLIDPREVTEEQAAVIAERLREFFTPR